MREDNPITVDIDKERILEIVEISYDFILEFSNCSFFKSKEDTLSELARILNSNRITTTILLDFSNTYIEDLQLRINIRRKQVLGITGKFRKKKNKINSFLRTL